MPTRSHPSPQRKQGNAGGLTGWGADSSRLRFGLGWETPVPLKTTESDAFLPFVRSG